MNQFNISDFEDLAPSGYSVSMKLYLPEGQNNILPI